ncbi:uncharacterized protein BO80DRAFT_280840 [Aspergillus ibericus CBS 121593]|uniref:Uncharacterized protein n=1 Tax=Aspergillus ibericus CBS 121593 TaxID=1448316 RepID=A0A395GI71_9EURO|nr:hypothetical protein BO80DRAFT_280840 [Aspergillus ibericus CBS 121593]RAK95034.1 hypothetical protein BO80DRAFT_280840 [Aspergillus ibericus CBS 121593]
MSDRQYTNITPTHTFTGRKSEMDPQSTPLAPVCSVRWGRRSASAGVRFSLQTTISRPLCSSGILLLSDNRSQRERASDRGKDYSLYALELVDDQWPEANARLIGAGEGLGLAGKSLGSGGSGFILCLPPSSRSVLGSLYGVVFVVLLSITMCF